MAYDEALAQRIREATGSREGVSERKMFGGIAFMLNGNMFTGVVGSDLMCRVGPERFEEALMRPGARPMDFTGRPAKGMVYVDASGYEADGALAAWVDECIAFASGLPPKQRPSLTKPTRARARRRASSAGS